MINYKLLAIQNLVPNALVSVLGNKVIWHDERTQPTEEEIVQKIAELEYKEEVKEYQKLRASEYPPYSDYLDGLVKGDQDQIDTYVAACQAVKDKYPKSQVDETELTSRKTQALFDYQLEQYRSAVKRLSQHVLAGGREQVTEMQDGPNQLTDSDGQPQFDSDGNPVYEQIEVVTVTAIDPLPATVTQTQYDSDMTETQVEIENPLITKDNAERAAAQAIVDATPQAVKDAA